VNGGAFYSNLLVPADVVDEAPQHAYEEETSSRDNIDTRAPDEVYVCKTRSQFYG
jgi:hypothetical protein